MKLRIKHLTQYEYSKSVFLEPHHLYFYPAHRNYLQLNSFELQVDPVPAGTSFRIDAESNAFHQCWFNDAFDQLTVSAEMVIETHFINPFDFIVEQAPKEYPLVLKPHLEHEELPPEIGLWLQDVIKPAGNNLVTLLNFLNKEIYADWDHTIRYEPTLLSINECFNNKKGSCRDLSWLMIQMLRSINIPARFVSGYAFNPDLGEGHELHAWVEAYVNGAGWIGFDPNSGLLATDHYVPVVSSYDPKNTFPVQGNYSGDASSTLTFEVEISQID